ncbi:MAG: YdeI/OmpD-associated family protein [Chitinophagales bacterium]
MRKRAIVEFSAVIHKSAVMDNTYVPVPFDVEKTFGKKRLKAKIWYDKVLYRGLLAKYAGEYNLMINKEIRAKIGKEAGDTVNIKIEEDTEERTLEIPEVMNNFFKKEKALKTIFDKLAYTHQKEFMVWISSAKREETLQNRLVKFKQMLLEKPKK